MQGGGNDFSDSTMTEQKVETYMEQWIQLVFNTKPAVKIIVTGPPQWWPTYGLTLAEVRCRTAGAGQGDTLCAVRQHGGDF
jgi:hypothetical protein